MSKGVIYTLDRETNRLVEKKRSSHAQAPLVQQDTIDPTVSDADGETYTSRSGLRNSIRAAGCEVITAKEAFEQRIARVRGDMNSRNCLREAVEQAYYDRRDGRVPAPDIHSVADVVAVVEADRE